MALESSDFKQILASVTYLPKNSSALQSELGKIETVAWFSLLNGAAEAD
jgi:hypothetical protein